MAEFVTPHSSPAISGVRTDAQVVLSLAGLALIASPAFAGKFNKVVSVGDKAPAFSGIPAAMGDKDTSLTLSDIKEDVVVLVFLANHCPVVTAYEDRIIDFTNDYKGKSVKVVGVSVNDIDSATACPAIKDYMKEKGSNYVYGYDESQAIGKAYGATNTPQFFVLDKDRVIRYIGAMDDNQNESQGHQDLPPRRRRRRPQGREPSRSPRPSPRAAASATSEVIRVRIDRGLARDRTARASGDARRPISDRRRRPIPSAAARSLVRARSRSDRSSHAARRSARPLAVDPPSTPVDVRDGSRP